MRLTAIEYINLSSLRCALPLCPSPSMTFSQWLAEEMKRAELNQAALAHEAGLHLNTVNRYCTGQQLPSLQNFRFLCDALAWMQLEIYQCSSDEKKLLSDQLMYQGLTTI
tara:strand:- start:1106 stop:1435 length:330 start_codon:yes stop_codon:yes gene_type:complete